MMSIPSPPRIWSFPGPPLRKLRSRSSRADGVAARIRSLPVCPSISSRLRPPISLSFPDPPLIVFRPCPAQTRSLPAPAKMWSSPLPPTMTSSLGVPCSSSGPDVPTIVAGRPKHIGVADAGAAGSTNAAPEDKRQHYKESDPHEFPSPCTHCPRSPSEANETASSIRSRGTHSPPRTRPRSSGPRASANRHRRGPRRRSL